MMKLVSWAFNNKQKALYILLGLGAFILVSANIASRGYEREEIPESTLLEFETSTSKSLPNGCVIIEEVMVCEHL